MSSDIAHRALRRGRQLQEGVRTIRRSSRSPNAVYLGWLGYANVGDEWLRDLILRELGGKIVVGAENLTLLKAQSRLLIGLGDMPPDVVIGGGTLLGTERVGEQVRLLLREHPRARVMSIGSGLESGTLSSEWIESLRNASLLVRGVRTQRRLAAAGLSSRIIGDPGFLLQHPAADDARTGTSLILNFSANVLRQPGGRELMSRSVSEMAKVSQDYSDIRLLVLSPEDDAVTRLALKQLPRRVQTVKVYREPCPRPEMFIADRAIGQRLHFGIFAGAVGTPFRLVEYHSKMRDVEETLGIPITLGADGRWSIRDEWQDIDHERKVLKQRVDQIRWEVREALRVLDLGYAN